MKELRLFSYFYNILGEDLQVSLEFEKPIRVMRIIARMNVGGPAVQVAGLMRGLNGEKFDHRLYTGFCASDEADYLETVANDINAVRIEGFGRHISMSADLRALISLVREIRRFKPDVIHTHTAKAGLLGRIASVISLQPSLRVHTFHGHLLTGYFGKFKQSLVVIAERLLAIFTDELLAVGDKVREDLLQSGVGSRVKFGLMPPGLLIGTLPSKIESRESLGLSANRLQCAYIGRVTQIKRPDRFLDVVKEIKKRNIKMDFFMVGDGKLLDACRLIILNESLPVTVLGWQSHIEKVLSAADFVVLTSDNEGTPLSLIQAGMAGIPVVATNVGSVHEIILDNVTGIITSLDVQDIANSLEKLAGDIDFCAKLGNAAKKFTLANFGVNRLVSDHEALYMKLLSSRRIS